MESRQGMNDDNKGSIPKSKIDTKGGSYIAGDAQAGKDLIGRDKIQGAKVEGIEIKIHTSEYQQQKPDLSTENKSAKYALWGTLITAILTFAGIGLKEYFDYQKVQTQIQTPIYATQTAEAQKLPQTSLVTSTFTVTTTVVSRLTDKPIPTATWIPTDTATLVFADNFDDLSGWQNILDFKAVTLPGYDGSSVQIEHNRAKWGGGIILKVPSSVPFRTGESYQVSIWCKPKRGEDCEVYFSTFRENDDKNKLNWSTSGNGVWNYLSNCMIMKSDESDMFIGLYAPDHVDPRDNVVQYDNLEIKKIAHCSPTR